MNKNSPKIVWENKGKVILGIDDNFNIKWGSRNDLKKPNIKLINSFFCDKHENNFDEESNILIKGDNLYSLLLLNEQFSEKIKCIYIDPPFNTGKIFDHYSDALERPIWLSLIKTRLELMYSLLAEDGVIFVHIDDDEMPYLKILLDEIFCTRSGRSIVNSSENHIATIIWEKKKSPQNDAKFFSDVHDFILIYAKNTKKLKINSISRNQKQLSRYKNIDNDHRGKWTSSDLSVRTFCEENNYSIITPTGREIFPSKGRSWGVSKLKLKELIADNRIWFGINGNSGPRVKKFLSEVRDGVVPKSLWLSDEVGDNSEAKKEIKKYSDRNKIIFSTPKPERLLQRIIQLSTNENDYVLDAYLGSGTTCVVAENLKRKWIGLENGNQMEDIVIPRLIDTINKKKNTKSPNFKDSSNPGFVLYKID